MDLSLKQCFFSCNMEKLKRNSIKISFVDDNNSIVFPIMCSCFLMYVS